MVYGHYTNHIVYDNEPLTFSTTINWVKNRQNKTQIGPNTVAKIKRYRDKMKTNTDKYELRKKKETKQERENQRKKEWQKYAEGNEETEKRKTKKLQNKTKIKVIQKGNEEKLSFEHRDGDWESN